MNCERFGRELNPVEAMIGQVFGNYVKIRHAEVTQSPRSESNVCDNRLTAAYDEGARDKELQIQVCTTIGDEIADHSCDVT